MWQQYFKNNFSPCVSHREHSDNAAHTGGPLCPIAPGSSFTIVDIHSAPSHYYPTYRAVEHVWADGILAGCATVVYHVVASSAEPIEPISTEEALPGERHAVCHLRPTSQFVVGSGLDDDGSAVMYLTSTVGGGTTVEIAAHGLNSSWPHGIHIHQLGNLGDIVAGTSAGAHYNPHAAAHGCARAGRSGESGGRKVGDLGNLRVDEAGNGYYYEAGNMLLTLDGASSVIGRSLVLHALPDNCVAEEGAAGDLSAGSRIGICTIGVDAPSSEQRESHRRQIRRAYYGLLLLGSDGDGALPPAQDTWTSPSPPLATAAAAAATVDAGVDGPFSWAHIILGFAVGGGAGLMVGRRQVRQEIGYTKAETSED